MYSGGGYVYKILGSINQTYDEIQSLFENNWIDRNTRTLFVEFSIYNPNINLFAFCSILFEFLPSGNIVYSLTVDSFDLFNANTYAKLLTKVAYLIIVLVFMLIEIKKMYKLKKLYFVNSLNIFEWVLYSCSIASLIMFTFKTNSASQILDSVKLNSVNGYIRLQTIKYWNDMTNTCFALCTFVGFIKMTKLLDKSRSVFILITSLKNIIKRLFQFLLILILTYLTFGQIFYLILYDQLYSFSNYLKTLETLFQMTLGKFNSNAILTVSPLFGIVLIFLFNLIVVLSLLCIFFTIVGETFQITKKTLKVESLNFYSSLTHKLNKMKKGYKDTPEYRPKHTYEQMCLQAIESIEKLKLRV